MLKLALAGVMALALTPVPFRTMERLDPPRISASGPINGYMVPQPPLLQRGSAAAPVFFVEQEEIDNICGGKDQIVACAMVGGGPMMLPNPCQARFHGESFAAIACHEKGHTLGWRHG